VSSRPGWVRLLRHRWVGLLVVWPFLLASAVHFLLVGGVTLVDLWFVAICGIGLALAFANEVYSWVVDDRRRT
jgi:hypothetical protein